MPRPKLPERTSINVYLTREQKDYLVKKAHDTGRNPSEIVRGLVEWIRDEPGRFEHVFHFYMNK